MKPSKRINVTIPYETNELLDRWCALTGASKSKVVSMMLQNSMPALGELMDSVEQGHSLETLARFVNSAFFPK